MCFEWLYLYFECVLGCLNVFCMCVWGGEMFEYMCVSTILLSNTHLKHT